MVDEQAIAYGAALRSTDVEFVATRLYRYNTAPVTRRWLASLPDGPAVERFLGIEPGGRARAMLDSRWRPVVFRDRDRGWSGWAATGEQATARGGRRRPLNKVYVSPMPGESGAAVHAVVESLTGAGIPVSLKLACTARGLLRPDKMMLYCADEATRRLVVDRLRGPLRGMRPQGVPFTVVVDPAQPGVSWGLDPPTADDADSHSWRSWIVAQIAAALVEAQQEGLGERAAASFARARLSAAGVGADWRPVQGLWSMP
ncbi:hypothetical protein [Streptomyces sp. NPDC093544]|uniref:hypothetical protein n=1 Tax=Streptomyces sp. NPDC093544 TaxID=3155200 RepID=UPI00343D55F1